MLYLMRVIRFQKGVYTPLFACFYTDLFECVIRLWVFNFQVLQLFGCLGFGLSGCFRISVLSVLTYGKFERNPEMEQRWSDQVK